jgi:hypothetical protein
MLSFHARFLNSGKGHSVTRPLVPVSTERYPILLRALRQRRFTPRAKATTSLSSILTMDVITPV